MANLPTNFKDDILDTSVNTRRKYRMYENTDGTIELEDVTEYSQVGDEFGAGQINAINTEVNKKFDKNMIIRDMDAINALTQEGYAPDALALKEVNNSLNNLNFSWKKVNNIASIPTTANEILLRGLIIGSQYVTCVIPYESLTDTEISYNYGGYYYNSSSNGYIQTKISKTNISSIRIAQGSETPISVEIYYR